MSNVEVGKSAKRIGKVHPRVAKKFERPVARPPAGLPPHKVRKVYAMTVTETKLTVNRTVYRYETKQARDQAKARMEKEDARTSPWDSWQRGDRSHSTESTSEYLYSNESAPEPGAE